MFPSCNSKMEYIIESLQSLGYSVYILSLGQGPSLKKQVHEILNDKLIISYLGTIPNRGFFSFFSKLFLVLQLLIFVIFRISKNSKVIVYHSVYLAPLFSFIKKIKNIEIIYEVEEIYNAAWNKDEKDIDKEIKSLQFADKLILVNDLLSKKINNFKPFIICYGNYNIIRNNYSKQYKDINIVYAGIIGDIDSDVYVALDAIKFLPLNYHLKILGYGNLLDLANFKLYISNSERISFDGLLQGAEYSKYLLKCHVGVAPRKLNDNLSDFTFPSKVLVYLGHNLHTVVSNINCIKKSKIADSVYFIEDLSPRGLASVIEKIEVNSDSAFNILEDLDTDFKINLKELLAR